LLAPPLGLSPELRNLVFHLEPPGAGGSAITAEALQRQPERDPPFGGIVIHRAR
jgi:hypothetical protein